MRRPFFLLPLLLLGSCALPGDFGAILEGNARFRQGDYEGATAAYLRVRDSSLRPLVDYDLANAWSLLGEPRAAEALYAVAAKEGSPVLRRDAWYNLGYLRLEGGGWEEAWKAFREALRLDPGDEGARRGLEIAWKAWKKEESSAPRLPSPAAARSFSGVSEELRLLRRLETGAWRPGNPAEGGGEARDW